MLLRAIVWGSLTAGLLGAMQPAKAQNDLQAGIQDLVNQIIASLEQGQKRKLAIMEFARLDGSTDNFGRYLSERLITSLFLTRKFEVIERRQLDKILAELKLNLTDLIDPENAKQLGRIYGVDAIASGSVTELAETLEANARLIETETGRVFAVAVTRFRKDKDIENSGSELISDSTDMTAISHDIAPRNGTLTANFTAAPESEARHGSPAIRHSCSRSGSSRPPPRACRWRKSSFSVSCLGPFGAATRRPVSKP